MSETGLSSEEESKNGDTKTYPLKKVTIEKTNFVQGGFKGWHFIFVNEGNLAKSSESTQI